jgi:hypothetical protein
MRLLVSRRLPVGLFAAALLAALLAPPLAFAGRQAKHPVPFKGVSEQQAVSAVPVDPDHVLVTTVGEGNATHLGHFTFVSPHLSGLSDFSIDGTQNFTAANGDELYGKLSGKLAPFVDTDGHVYLVGSVAGTITGGTGRFAGASGSYTFSLVFDTETAHSFGAIDGEIQFAGN